MMRLASLRIRLFALILTPLVLMAVLLGFWRLTAAQHTAEALFDRGLLASALAISRDVAVSGGDALLRSTSDLIDDAAGGQVFYHATGPGGIYVTGYAYPPNPDVSGALAQPIVDGGPDVFEANYRGEPVRVMRLTERISVDGLTGDSTVTVWQRLAERQAFANQLAIRAISLMGALLLTLAIVVWFGVGWGLWPLIDLRNAIAERSPNDLSRIKRPVPAEAKGIVNTLNSLFSKLESNLQAHQAFISDAAHQLRNPVAAVQSMTEAVKDAGTEMDRKQRTRDLEKAARNVTRITEQLLSMDRLRHTTDIDQFTKFDLRALIQDLCAEQGSALLSADIAFEFDAPPQPIMIEGDALFLSEAVKNLIDNAMTHGGADLSTVGVRLRTKADVVCISVHDDGKGLSPSQQDAAFRRFSQLEPSSGSGLGLAIAKSVAEKHGGKLVIDTVENGASLTLTLPVTQLS
ncbi:sensor histidine kinase [Cognatishimia sp. WU-CL00825]|uniref:sensor histidine kinase n=1 Tax=Cognatishimia sp. WU-CL00825 TaxID=3127658 RepID=UPI0031066D49